MTATMTDAARDVIDERERQKDEEGWTPEHDDEHDLGQLGHAAACYAASDLIDGALRSFWLKVWPWHEKWWKPTDRRRDLVKAGALILAEIERIDREPISPAKSPASESADAAIP